MAKIKYLLQGKSNPTSIYVRLSIGRGNTPKRKTGIYINPDEWSESGFAKTAKKGKKPKPGNDKINEELKDLESTLLKEYNKDYAGGVTINSDWLSDKIDIFFSQGKEQKDLNIITEYITHFLSTLEFKPNSKGGIGLSRSRVNDYKTLLKIIKEYQGKTPLLIKNVNLKFKSEFEKWMTNKKNNYSKGYTGRMLGNLKTVCLDAELNDITTHKQLKKFSGFKVKNEFVVYLSKPELEKIALTELPFPYLENARKWLLLGANIGQRGNDLLDLNEDNFIVRNGLRVIELVQQKTGKSVTIPVLPETDKILKTGLPHKISLQKFNDYIKDVCRIAEIDNIIQGKKLDLKTKRHVTGFYKKWELITSHICRRSFATNLYGILPTPLIMQVTAHSNERTFSIYLGKNSYDYAQQIADFYTKQALKENNNSPMEVIKNEPLKNTGE
jgi:integrase